MSRWRAWPTLAAGLGLVLLVELRPGTGKAPPKEPALSVADISDISSVAAQDWSQTILARPLFNANRRPAGGDFARNGLPRLSAIIITQGHSSAIFAAIGEKPLVVQAGGTVDGELVQQIDPDGVVLLTPNGPTRLLPRFASQKATGAPPDTPPPDLGPASSQPMTSSTTAGPYDNE